MGLLIKPGVHTLWGFGFSLATAHLHHDTWTVICHACVKHIPAINREHGPRPATSLISLPGLVVAEVWRCCMSSHSLGKGCGLVCALHNYPSQPRCFINNPCGWGASPPTPVAPGTITKPEFGLHL